MIKRAITPHILRLAKKYPIITITGPRQSGKTTLARAAFPHKPYQTLEDPDTRRVAEKDPRQFLRQFPKGAVIDEVQRVPHLLSYIQTIVDESKQTGLFILTGSAQFELMHTITQSLAGRTALFRLLPFTVNELPRSFRSTMSADDYMYTGFYPRIYDKKINPTEALSFYINTYIERDVRILLNVRDLSKFETFVRLCATRAGQLINLSSLGNECGINHNTAAHWLSILEASYIVFKVHPHHQNFSKRLIKASKLYFYDTGLACYLLGIKSNQQLSAHPLRGAIFENFITAEIVKQLYNSVKDNNLFFFRDNIGNEVDLILDHGSTVLPVEIKSGETFSSDMLKGLAYYQKINKHLTASPVLVYGGDKTFQYQSFRILSWHDINTLQI
jgi:hypothetical protein